MARLVFHGHAAVEINTDGGATILIDPWLDGNPLARVAAADVDADFIFCTHGHSDHFADVVPIAKRTNALVVGAFEITSYLESRGVSNVHGMNIGGGFDFPFGRAKMTAALHGCRVDGEGAAGFNTMPAGFLLDVDGTRVYHAGDTALLMDMQLLEGQVDVALLPIGDNYTMGPADAARAVSFIRPDVVIPIHYNTFDVIRQDPHAFADLVGDHARVVVLEPGDTCDL